MPAACAATVASCLSATVPAGLCAATVASVAGLSTAVPAGLRAATVASVAGLSTTVPAGLCAAAVASVAGLSTTITAGLRAAAVAGIASLSATVASRLSSSAARVSARSTICTRCTTRSTIHSRGTAGALASVSMLRWGGMLRRGCVLCWSGMGCRCASATLLLRRSDSGYGEDHKQYGPFGQNILLSVARIHSHSCEMCRSLVPCIPPTGKRSRRARIVFFRPAATMGFSTITPAVECHRGRAGHWPLEVPTISHPFHDGVKQALANSPRQPTHNSKSAL
jgi:hypothetical protein